MKDQIKSPRLEERRKEVSQEAKDFFDNYTPQPDTNFDQLYDILVDYESCEITINQAIHLINKVITPIAELLSDYKSTPIVNVPLLVSACSIHNPKQLGYLQWHNLAEQKIKRGAKQKECPKCGRWYFQDEF